MGFKRLKLGKFGANWAEMLTFLVIHDPPPHIHTHTHTLLDEDMSMPAAIVSTIPMNYTLVYFR